jgi:hypothetical protein
MADVKTVNADTHVVPAAKNTHNRRVSHDIAKGHTKILTRVLF